MMMQPDNSREWTNNNGPSGSRYGGSSWNNNNKYNYNPFARGPQFRDGPAPPPQQQQGPHPSNNNMPWVDLIPNPQGEYESPTDDNYPNNRQDDRHYQRGQIELAIRPRRWQSRNGRSIPRQEQQGFIHDEQADEFEATVDLRDHNDYYDYLDRDDEYAEGRNGFHPHDDDDDDYEDGVNVEVLDGEYPYPPESYFNSPMPPPSEFGPPPPRWMVPPYYMFDPVPHSMMDPPPPDVMMDPPPPDMMMDSPSFVERMDPSFASECDLYFDGPLTPEKSPLDCCAESPMLPDRCLEYYHHDQYENDYEYDDYDHDTSLNMRRMEPPPPRRNVDQRRRIMPRSSSPPPIMRDAAVPRNPPPPAWRPFRR